MFPDAVALCSHHKHSMAYTFVLPVVRLDQYNNDIVFWCIPTIDGHIRMCVLLLFVLMVHLVWCRALVFRLYLKVTSLNLSKGNKLQMPGFLKLAN